MSQRRNSEDCLQVLANELAGANTHFDFAETLHAYYLQHGVANIFWKYTVIAHSSIAFLNLCRVYDYHKKGINLINCLKSIDEGALHQVDRAQLSVYVGLCGEKSQDHWVQTLRTWRHNIVAHYNIKAALDRKAFDKNNPDEPSEILRNLIPSGFKILEWCSGVHGKATTYPRFAPGKESCADVLKSLQICKPS